MAKTMAAEIRRLQCLTVKELKKKFEEVFGEACRSSNREHLWKRIAWRIQADQEGGLSDRAKRRACELADESEIRILPPRDAFSAFETNSGMSMAATNAGTATGSNGKYGPTFTSGRDSRLPPPGSLITREYKGRRIEVTVLEKGFEFDGVVYRSLSAVAKAVTGSHCSGMAFFRMNKGQTTFSDRKRSTQA